MSYHRGLSNLFSCTGHAAVVMHPHLEVDIDDLVGSVAQPVELDLKVHSICTLCGRRDKLQSVCGRVVCLHCWQRCFLQ